MSEMNERDKEKKTPVKNGRERGKNIINCSNHHIIYINIKIYVFQVYFKRMIKILLILMVRSKETTISCGVFIGLILPV